MHVGIVILSVVQVLQNSEMGTEGEALTCDIGQNRDEAMTSAAVRRILEGMHMNY